MSIDGVRRRLRSLEASVGLRVDQYPLLTESEVLDIERRAHAGSDPTKLELARIERQNPIMLGELMMSSYHGRLFMKRYIGIDLAEV